VPRDKQAVADAMHMIQLLYPGLHHKKTIVYLPPKRSTHMAGSSSLKLLLLHARASIRMEMKILKD
jgi:hypothetical protein